MDSELPNKLAHLDLMEVDQNASEVTSAEENVAGSTSRVLRKRKPSNGGTIKLSNRRVSMKPTKRFIRDDSNPKQIEALYLNKKVKTVSQTLETIYEEPKPNTSGAENGVNGKKVKRLLTFQLGNQYTKEKIKKRRAKIKKLLGNKSFLNRKKIPMQAFLKTIECLDLDEVLIESQTINGSSKATYLVNN